MYAFSLPCLRTMCGSRTGGWSLPCVMSDWRRCVDWFLAKYYRCRLRLDSCWYRWRTRAKGRCWWGLQVWRRQVGFVRGTRWPAGSSAGRMVATTARWSRWTVSWLSHKTKVKPGLHGSQVKSGDWWRLHQVRGVCGGSPENHWVTRLSHKAETEDRAWLSGQNQPDRFGEPVWPVWGSRAPEASRRRTRVRIASLASRLREVRSPGIRPMVLWRQIPKVPLVGVYLSLGFRGFLDFRLASI
jgi:hypothetical protein